LQLTVILVYIEVEYDAGQLVRLSFDVDCAHQEVETEDRQPCDGEKCVEN
jgi:hypothetical protein